MDFTTEYLKTHQNAFDLIQGQRGWREVWTTWTSTGGRPGNAVKISPKLRFYLGMSSGNLKNIPLLFFFFLKLSFKSDYNFLM